jgi:hypothetical protein
MINPKIKIVFIVLIITTCISTNGQNANKKNNISIGGGSQGYKGDLGSVWFDLEEELYGFAAVYYNRYLNKSFDLTTSLTYGEFGHCREPDESAYRDDGTEILNMLAGLTTFVISGKYKFANGYLIKEEAKICPYVFLGAGINNITEKFWPDKTRAREGFYGSINMGLGFRYNFSEKFNFTYNLSFGYFTSDNMDKRVEGSNDMYMQNAGMLGINF